MRKQRHILVAVALALGIIGLAGLSMGGSLFSDVTSHGGGPKAVAQINAGLDALEDNLDGTTALASPVIQGTLTAVSTNGATTNVVITVAGLVDSSKLTGTAETFTFTNVTWNVGANTGNWVFVNGRLSSHTGD